MLTQIQKIQAVKKIKYFLIPIFKNNKFHKTKLGNAMNEKMFSPME